MYHLRNCIWPNIGEAEAAAQSERQTHSDASQTYKEHGFNPDVCQVIQAKMEVLGIPSCTELELRIVYEIINYHFEHSSPSYKSKSRLHSNTHSRWTSFWAEKYLFGAERHSGNIFEGSRKR